MKLTDRLLRFYFNHVYNRIYDFTVSKLNRYGILQSNCISKLEIKDSDKILCVGLGTGNEILHILRSNRNTAIVGIDFSEVALRIARKKSLKHGKDADIFIMDAGCLALTGNCFDKIVCVHLMDFVHDEARVAAEILRVLRKSGQFVITFPSTSENVNLGADLLRDNFRHHVSSGKNWLAASLAALLPFLIGMVYLPLLLRPRGRAFSKLQLQILFKELKPGFFKIEEDSIYHDFVVSGIK